MHICLIVQSQQRGLIWSSLGPYQVDRSQYLRLHVSTAKMELLQHEQPGNPWQHERSGNPWQRQALQHRQRVIRRRLMQPCACTVPPIAAVPAMPQLGAQV